MTLSSLNMPGITIQVVPGYKRKSNQVVFFLHFLYEGKSVTHIYLSLDRRSKFYVKSDMKAKVFTFQQCLTPEILNINLKFS